ncbi:MAG: glycoside hydrolase family 127 protein [Gemmatales bacterium]|nr:glycoside hydrolase family 127 protein [Gemmatales bacterium]MDW8385955.1 glycoside hydrolase family 127 protein [Gemmatales bacterium]
MTRVPCAFANVVAVWVSLALGIPAIAAELRPVPFREVRIQDGFWSPRLEVNRTVTAQANLRQCEITGRIRNFAVAAGREPGRHQGLLFNDSDVYKALEGIAYALADKRDPALEKQADAIIDLIAAAQQPDGYLNTYYTLVKPEERWKNTAHGHEMYCAGHLIEAGIAYHQATGKTKLLEVARRFADHICDTFGPGKRIDVCGHEEIELALIRLYRHTGEKKYLDQARFFLETRGRGEGRQTFGEYAQDHKPIREQDEVVGHAVRAMYLYCAIADYAAITGDRQLLANLEKIWDDVTQRKMYITGGIGSSASNEGFTKPYDLPNDSAYAETCAAVGLALWSHRMFLLTRQGKYADLVERLAYNGLLSGVSLSGDRFFYTNPLGTRTGTQRVPWFACACCPPNILRWIASIGDRVYAQDDDSIYTVLFVAGDATVSLAQGPVRIKQTGFYPWEGQIRFAFDLDKPQTFSFYVRIPEWLGDQPYVIATPTNQDLTVDRDEQKRSGFVRIHGTWRKGDVVEVTLPMTPQRRYAHPEVKENVGRVALTRGPFVYCLEGVDNGGQVRNLVLPRDAELTARKEPDLLGGVVVLEGTAQAVRRKDDGSLAASSVNFVAIPYYTWANRGPSPMVVWIPEKIELAELPGEDGVLSNGVIVRASHCWVNDTVTALNDGRLPKSSGDHDIPRMTWWDRQGTVEWVAYRFPSSRKVQKCRVYWFDDTGRGACRVPASWRLLYLDGKDWKEVSLRPGSTYGTALDRFNEIVFEPVMTRELRLEVRLKPGFSGGILEWIVE